VEYYGIGHFNKFFRLPSHRIDVSESSSTTACVDSTAFLNADSSIHLVALNNCTDDIWVTVEWENYTFDYQLPVGIVTFVWNSNQYN